MASSSIVTIDLHKLFALRCFSEGTFVDPKERLEMHSLVVTSGLLDAIDMITAFEDRSSL